jgi:hypothetical protein
LNRSFPQEADMPRTFRPLALVAATTLLVTSAMTAQSDRPAKGRWQCDTNMGGPTIYATQFFEWTGHAAELQNAFQQHLLAQHGYKERVNCRMASPGGPALAELDADMQRQHVQFRAQGKKVVPVPWTITSPGVTLAYTCFGVAQVRRTGIADSTYILRSKVYRIQVGSQAELSLRWIDHLKSLHPDWYFQSPGCVLLPADAAGHQAIIDAQVAMYERFKPRVTQLDWPYRSGAAAEAVEAVKPTVEEVKKPAEAPSPVAKPILDRFGRPIPAQTFYCQYLGLALDSSGKYPLYQNELFTVASTQGLLQNAWKAFIESTYHPTSPGNPMCAIMPSDPAQREAAMKSVDLLKQTGTQKVIKVVWKP